MTGGNGLGHAHDGGLGHLRLRRRRWEQRHKLATRRDPLRDDDRHHLPVGQVHVKRHAWPVAWRHAAAATVKTMVKTLARGRYIFTRIQGKNAASRHSTATIHLLLPLVAYVSKGELQTAHCMAAGDHAGDAEHD